MCNTCGCQEQYYRNPNRCTCGPCPVHSHNYRKYRRNPSIMCPNCGTGNRIGREICWKCGFDLGSTPEERVANIRRRAFAGSPFRRNPWSRYRQNPWTTYRRHNLRRFY